MSTGTTGSVLLDRASQIVAIIPAGSRPVDLEAKVHSFLRVNGIAPVEEAARLLAARIDRGKTPADPWAFLVDVVNQDHANANILQVLVHWLENALRTRIDICLTDEHGPDWHHRLDNFVPGPVLGVSRMGADYFSSADLVRDTTAPGGFVPNQKRYPTGALFLADTTLKDLKLMASYCLDLARPNRLELREVDCDYQGCVPFGGASSGCCSPDHRHSTGRRLTMDAGCLERTRAIPKDSILLPSKVLSMIGSVYQARNEVAHSRRLGANLYSEAFRDARHLLVSLGFDPAKGTKRLERRRMSHVHKMLLSYGYVDGVNEILKA